LNNNNNNSSKNTNKNHNLDHDKKKKKNVNTLEHNKPLNSALKKNKDEPERTSKTVKFFDDVKNQKDNIE